MSTESIGEKLKKVRQQKGLTLEEVQKKTKIHLNILKAIEGEGLTNLSPVYLKGFLKIYCNFLGLDPKECIPDYKEHASIVPVQTSIPEERNKPLKSGPTFLENASLKLSSLPLKKIKKLLIFLLIAFVFIFVLGKIIKFISSRPNPSPAVVNLQKRKVIVRQAPVAPVVKPKAKAQEAVLTKTQVAAETKLPKEASGGISLVISAKENCLVFVKVDGRVVLHRVLERGRSDSWKAKDKIELSLGNAAAVELIVNGQRFSDLGRRGQQLKNIVITEKEGLKIPR